MPPKKQLDSQLNLAFLFGSTRILLSVPSATPVSSLPMLLLPPLQLVPAEQLDFTSVAEDDLRVCRRVEGAREGSFRFVALKQGETVYRAIQGNPNELLFLQLKSPSGGWAPVKVTIPSIEDQPVAFDDEDDDDESGAMEQVDEAESEPAPSASKGKGKGKAREDDDGDEVIELD